MTSPIKWNKVANDYGVGRTPHGAKAVYDFAVDGGAISNITPVRTDSLPLGAIITDVWTDTPTNLTSGGSATVQILVGTQSIVAAAAFDTSYDAPRKHTLVGTQPIKVTAAANIEITIATATLTAGKMNIWIDFRI